MAPRHPHAACGKRCQCRVRLLQGVFVLSAALLALGAALVGIGLLRAPAPEAVRHVSSGPGAVEQSQMATADFAALKYSVDWDNTKDMPTVDTDPGGKLQWDPKTGRIRICDSNTDGHLVRGMVSADGHAVKLSVLGHLVDSVQRGGKGHCREAAIPDYKPTKEYELKVCLAGSDTSPDGYCNTSNTSEWPKVDHKNNYCWDLKTDQEKIDCVGGVQEFCHQWQHIDSMFPKQCVADHTKKSPAALKPPDWDEPALTDKPDAKLPRGHADGVSRVAQPLNPLLRWLVWTALGACVLGFVMVGGNMALKHRRGEGGAHAAELGWVMIACVVAGSGLAIAFIALLLNPL